MPKMLIDGAVEYEDGTPATEAQVGFYFHFISFILQMWLRTLPSIYILYGVHSSFFHIVMV